MFEDILSLISMVLSVALICLLAYFVTRKLGTNGMLSGIQNQSSTKIKVYERMVLAPNKSLMVVRVCERWLVLGISNENISLITELTEEQAKTFTDNDKKTASSGFMDIFSQMLNNKNSKGGK